MSKEQKKDETPQASMVPQLGSAPKTLARGEFDERKLSYLVPPEKMPTSFKPIHYALTRRDVVIYKKRLWDAVCDNYLTLVDSIEGRGQNNIIRAENAMKGISVPLQEAPEKPGILKRIFDKEAVEDYERYKERKDLGLEP